MSGDFVWAVKNGDLEQVKDIIEKKVGRQISVKNLKTIKFNDSLFYSLLM